MISFVVVGHIDHGKSSLIGRLLVDTGKIKKDIYDKIRRRFRDEYDYALFLDSLKNEQICGITIDTTRLRFSYKERDFVIVDVPGHKEFLKNMVTGASSADVAVVVVDIEEGLQEQTYMHIRILSVLGIKNVINVINKMDRAGYSYKKFLHLKDSLEEFEKSLQMNILHTVPVSAKLGDNICFRSDKMNWYKEPVFIDCFSELSIKEQKDDFGSRFVVQGKYKDYVLGRCISGKFEKFDKITVYPSCKETIIEDIFLWPRTIFCGRCNQSICIKLKDDSFIKRGNIICKSNEKKITMTSYVISDIFWLDEHPLQIADRLFLKVMTSEASVYVSKIISTGKNKLPEQVSQNECATVKLTSVSPLLVEKHSDISELGRFILVRNSRVCGGGIVL